MGELEKVIIEAKSAAYIGGATALPAPSRMGAHDISWRRGDWSYLDSYFGGTDFSGQEVVWRRGEPVWAMSYFGYIIHDDRIDAPRAGAVIKHALGRLYAEEGRFLGGFACAHDHGVYIDENEGDFTRFTGRERIEVGGVEAYNLVYHGGLIRP
ncbi:DUF5680 domain-containing protein [Rhizobium sp. TRM95796]|uniref:DUF5680 domain-containing protein n=1 Tax=Rhizobium sp. TRM95796 TaxID=2979862 RepID=UPI0021E78E9F|nr:DUF5680 domain-containing protein [Rhizobium sp. TRM95796]MCV3765415.1 DUF5680 domain-containing protein [Rhizobium sp. TRM95796]